MHPFSFPNYNPLTTVGMESWEYVEYVVVTVQHKSAQIWHKWNSVCQVRELLQWIRASHLEPSLPVVFCDAVVLAGSSVEAVADTQDGGEQGACELIAHSDGQLHRLRDEQRPCQEAVTWSRKVTRVI